jgi:hypothetical protein
MSIREIFSVKRQLQTTIDPTIILTGQISEYSFLAHLAQRAMYLASVVRRMS